MSKANLKPLTQKTTRKDLYAEVTAEVIAAIESGTNPFSDEYKVTCPDLWNGANVTTGMAYNGVNRLILAIEVSKKRYEKNLWLTFNQARAKKLNVRKGEKGTRLTFYKRYEKETKNDTTGEKTKEARFLLSAFYVFNISQLEGDITDLDTAINDSKMALDVIATCPVPVQTGRQIPYYSPVGDYINMPKIDTFSSEQAWLATFCHEAVHATGHATRLNRLADDATFGSESYAFEELVAEMGATFLCADLGIQSKIEHHASYLASWLKVLKNDSKAIFKASSMAQKACEYIKNGWQVKATDTNTDSDSDTTEQAA